MQQIRKILLVSALGALAACAGGAADDPVRDDDPPVGDPPAVRRLTIAANPVQGPALQVEDALDAGDDPILVSGSLFIDADGRVMLCGAIAESFPPQCGGERLEVIGLDAAEVPGLQEANGVRWAEMVELSGTVD